MSIQLLLDLSEDDYHSSSGMGPDQWLTRSMVCKYIESPYLFWMYYVKDWTDDMETYEERIAFHGTPATRFGTFFEEYMNANVYDWTIADKSPKDVTEHPTTISHAELRLAKLMLAGTQQNEDAMAIYVGIVDKTLFPSVTLRRIDEVTGLREQVRFDWIDNRFLYPFDGKTANVPSEDKFKWKMIDLGYDVQSSMYGDLLQSYHDQIGNGDTPDPMTFLVYPKVKPFIPFTTQLDGASQANALHKYKSAIQGIIKEDWTDHVRNQTAPSLISLPGSKRHETATVIDEVPDVGDGGTL